MKSKLSFYLVLGVVLVGSVYLVVEMSRDRTEQQETTTNSPKEKSSGEKTPASSASEKSDGLINRFFNRSSGSKDRFGREVKEVAEVENQITNLRALFEGGNLGEMKTQLDKLIAANPKTPEYVALLGDYYLALDQYGPAEQTVRKLVSLDSKNAYAHEILSRVLAVRGNMDEARESLETALKLNPNSESALKKLVVFGEMNGNPDNGVQELQRYADANPRNASARVVLAETYLENGKPAEAVKRAEEAISIDYTNPSGHRLLSTHYAVSGDQNRAIEHAKAWAEYETNGDWVDAAHIQVLQLLQSSGRTNEAYDYALRMEPRSADAKQIVDQIVSTQQGRKSGK